MLSTVVEAYHNLQVYMYESPYLASSCTLVWVINVQYKEISVNFPEDL